MNNRLLDNDNQQFVYTSHAAYDDDVVPIRGNNSEPSLYSPSNPFKPEVVDNNQLPNYNNAYGFDHDQSNQNTHVHSDWGRLQEMEKQLAEKEQELNAREQKISELENNSNTSKRNNFPCRCWPLYYHNINEEIPADLRFFTKTLYITWFLTMLTFVVNLAGNILFIILDRNTKYFTSAALSGLYFLFGIPLSFRLWYWPQYCAFRDDQEPATIRFNLMFGVHIIFVLVAAVGIQGFGCLGWMSLSYVHWRSSLFYVCISSACLWTLVCILSIITIRTSAKTFAKAIVYQQLHTSVNNIQSILNNSRTILNQ